MKWPWTKSKPVDDILREHSRRAAETQDETLDRLRSLGRDADRSVRDADHMLGALQKIEEALSRIEFAMTVAKAEGEPKPTKEPLRSQSYVPGQVVRFRGKSK